MGVGQTSPTRKGVLVTIQRGEVLAVVTAEGVAGVALIGAEPQPVTFSLGLDVEAAVLRIHLLPGPVLQLYHQLIVALFPQVVDIFQANPVFTVDVPKAFLKRTSATTSSLPFNRTSRLILKYYLVSTAAIYFISNLDNK